MSAIDLAMNETGGHSCAYTWCMHTSHHGCGPCSPCRREGGSRLTAMVTHNSRRGAQVDAIL